jgi:hypothetical protein
MLVLKIALISVGILFIGFGYSIYFKKNYNLINNFKEDKKSNKFDDAYALRVGFIELIGGLTYVVLGTLAMFFNDAFIIIAFIMSVIGIIVALIINMVKSSNRPS